jgi:hypothetical protein
VGCKFVVLVLFHERVPLHIGNSEGMLSQLSLEVLILKQGARFLYQIHEIIILKDGNLQILNLGWCCYDGQVIMFLMLQMT